MDDDKKLTIPLEYLPENWRKTLAAEFDLSDVMIGKVANGTRKNAKVFDRLLDMAEKGKKAKMEEERLRVERLTKLTNEPLIA